jgi:hypothetical protein
MHSIFSLKNNATETNKNNPSGGNERKTLRRQAFNTTCQQYSHSVKHKKRQPRPCLSNKISKKVLVKRIQEIFIVLLSVEIAITKQPYKNTKMLAKKTLIKGKMQC